MLIFLARTLTQIGLSFASNGTRHSKPRKRSLVIVVAVCGMFATATTSAQDFLGFRLLYLQGTPVRWSVEGTGPARVTYAFVEHPVRVPEARNCEGMVQVDALLAHSEISLSVFRNEVRAAFNMWEQVTNISFRETHDMPTAGILIGAQALPEGWAFADVAQQPGHSGKIEKSLICLNPDRRWKVGFDGNLDVYDIRYTVAHEIGHAIGLDHPASMDQLMSYRYQEGIRGLHAGDIDGAAQLYGAQRAGRPSLARVGTRAR